MNGMPTYWIKASQKDGHHFVVCPSCIYLKPALFHLLQRHQFIRNKYLHPPTVEDHIIIKQSDKIPKVKVPIVINLFLRMGNFTDSPTVMLPEAWPN